MSITPASLRWGMVVIFVTACGGTVVGETPPSRDDGKDAASNASGAGGSGGDTLRESGGRSSGGVRSNTGGFQSNTGGFQSNTGGFQSNTGGFQSNTGGFQSNTGGAGIGGFDSGGASGAPAVCHPESAPDQCTQCVEFYCCQEYSDCIDVRCAGIDATGSDGELFCMVDCLTRGVAGLDGGAASLSACADMCKGRNAVLASTTTAAISCMTAPVFAQRPTQQCSVPCFGGNVL